MLWPEKPCCLSFSVELGSISGNVMSIGHTHSVWLCLDREFSGNCHFSKSSNIVNEQTILYRTRSFQKGQRIKAETHGRKRNLSSVKKLLLHRKPFFVPVGVQNKLFLISVAGPFLSIIQVLRHSGIMYLGVRLSPS